MYLLNWIIPPFLPVPVHFFYYLIMVTGQCSTCWEDEALLMRLLLESGFFKTFMSLFTNSVQYVPHVCNEKC